MNSVWTRLLTLAGGATFALSAMLALVSGTTELPLIGAVALLGLGIYQIYR